jgi:hypothetical protein
MWWKLEDEIIKAYKNENEWNNYIKNKKEIEDILKWVDFYKFPEKYIRGEGNFKIDDSIIWKIVEENSKVSVIVKARKNIINFLAENNLIIPYFLLYKAEDKELPIVECLGVLVTESKDGILVKVKVYRCEKFAGFHLSLSLNLQARDDDFEHSIAAANEYARKNDKTHGYVCTIAPYTDNDAERLQTTTTLCGNSLSAVFRLAIKSLLKNLTLDSNYVLTGGGKGEELTEVKGLNYKYGRVARAGKILVCSSNCKLENEELKEGKDKRKIMRVKNLDEAFSLMTGYTEAWKGYHEELEKKLQELPRWLVNKTLSNVYITRRLPSFEKLRKKLSSTGREKELEEKMKREITIQDTGLLEKEGAVIVGDMGVGKTTIFKYIGYEIIKKLEKELNKGKNIREIPIVISIFLKSLESLKVEEKKDKEIKITINFAGDSHEMLKIPEILLTGFGKNYIVLLDALDEYSYPEKMGQLLEEINKLLDNGARVYLTSRTETYEKNKTTLSNIFKENIFTLDPLSLEEIRELMNKLLTDTGRDYLKAELSLEVIEPLKLIQYAIDFLSNPLMLTLLCSLINEKAFSESELKRLNRAIIMERALQKFWDWFQQKKDVKLEGGVLKLYKEMVGVSAASRSKDLFLVLGSIAYETFIKNKKKREFTQDEADEAIGGIEEKISVSLREYVKNAQVKSEFLTLLVKLGYLSENVRSRYFFIHSAIQEYLAAWWVAKNLEEEDVKKKLEEIVTDRSYDEFLLFLGAILANKDKNTFDKYLRYIIDEREKNVKH